VEKEIVIGAFCQREDFETIRYLFEFRTSNTKPLPLKPTLSDGDLALCLRGNVRRSASPASSSFHA